jgi:hypothetical protein
MYEIRLAKDLRMHVFLYETFYMVTFTNILTAQNFLVIYEKFKCLLLESVYRNG